MPSASGDTNWLGGTGLTRLVGQIQVNRNGLRARRKEGAIKILNINWMPRRR
jgi:hypothetical protein